MKNEVFDIFDHISAFGEEVETKIETKTLL